MQERISPTPENVGVEGTLSATVYVLCTSLVFKQKVHLMLPIL